MYGNVNVVLVYEYWCRIGVGWSMLDASSFLYAIKMTNSSLQQYKVTLTIPFPNSRLTEICSAVLRIDKEPARSFITKTIDIVDDNLVINFSGDVAKNLRVAVSSFLESLILCCQTIKEFDIVT